MISFSSLSFEGSLQTGSLLSSFFWRSYETPLFRVLGSTLSERAGSRLKVILDFSLPSRTTFS